MNEEIMNRAKLYRVQKWNDKVSNEDYAEGLMRKFVNEYDLSEEVLDCINELYVRVRDEGLLKGRSVEVGVATCSFIGCRLSGEAYNVGDVINVIHVGKKEVNGFYRKVKRELGLKVPMLSASDYVPRYARELDLSEGVCSRALELVKLGEDNGVGNGKSPLGLVAGALYLACKEDGLGVTQRDIVGLVGVSEVVLRSRCYDLSGL
jgi:transcription initiation factor TFIIB